MNASSDIEAQRLKEILFPKKTKSSRTSIGSSIEYEKENKNVNKSTNLNSLSATSNIRTEILKLKSGIQQFLQKQSQSQNLLSTPRECLELIKYMTEGMCNYKQEIEEAIITLIDSIPKPIMKCNSSSKFFIMALKIQFISTLVLRLRRTKISEGFQRLRHNYSYQRQKQERSQQIERYYIKIQQIFNKNSLLLGFNRWRVNTKGVQKEQIQHYYERKNQLQMHQPIPLLTDESRMVNYLQKLLLQNTSADIAQILLYNPKTATLRSYKTDSDCFGQFGPIFQNMKNQSRISQFQQSVNGSIKRMQVSLLHGLTKISIIKKQTLILEDFRRDPDYTEIDDYTVFYGMSARQSLGGAIFVPIVSKNSCIGIIRQYFFGGIKQKPNAQLISFITEILDQSIKISSSFEALKDQTMLIRNKFYLKGIMLLNKMEAIDRFDENFEKKIQQLIQNYFCIKMVQSYSYNCSDSLGKATHFTIISSNEQSDSAVLTSVVAALNKMEESENKFLYENNFLYLKTSTKIYVFEMKTGQNENVPTYIILTALEKIELLKIKAGEQQERSRKQKEVRDKIEAERLQTQTKNQVLSFCTSQKIPENEDQFMQALQKYVNQFLDQKYQIILSKKHRKNKLEDLRKSTIIYQDICTIVALKRIENKINRQKAQIDQKELALNNIILPSLSGMCKNMLQNMRKPMSIESFRHLRAKEHIHYKQNEQAQSLCRLLMDLASLSETQISHMIIEKYPFNSETFLSVVEQMDLEEAKMGQPSMQRFLNNWVYSEVSGLNALNTIICLGGQLIIIVRKNLDLKDHQLDELNKIYKRWKSIREAKSQQRKQNQNKLCITKGSNKISLALQSNLKLVFHRLRNYKKRERISTQFIRNLLYFQLMKDKSRGFSILKSKFFDSQNKKIAFKEQYVSQKQKLSKFCLSVSNCFKKKFFQSIHFVTAQRRSLNKLSALFLSHQKTMLSVALNSIFSRKNLRQGLKLKSLVWLFAKPQSQAFQFLKRNSKKVELLLGETENLSQCSIISKLENKNEIYNIVKSQFPALDCYIYMRNGLYVSLSRSNDIFSSIHQKSQHVHCEFTAQQRSKLKSVVWLLPRSDEINLLEKHHLQVVSRAIEDGFQKYLFKNEQLLTILNLFFRKKIKSNMSRTLKVLKSFSMTKLKNQQYHVRNKYYEISIEVENLQQLAQEYKKQAEERNRQSINSNKIKNQYQEQLRRKQEQILKLGNFSMALERQGAQLTIDKEKKEKVKAFRKWRVQAAFARRYAQRRQLARKRFNFACLDLGSLLKTKLKTKLHYSFKRILFESAHVKSNTNKKALEQKDSNTYNSMPNPKRLLTFQDQLNDFTQDSNIQESMQKQLSIIPISFKYFQASKKQNYDVTDQQAKKVNGGAYKLNAKTLKFLKRMGKLSNN